MTLDERAATANGLLAEYTECSQEVACLQEKCLALGQVLSVLGEGLSRDPASLKPAKDAIETPRGPILDPTFSAAGVCELLADLHKTLDTQQDLYARLLRAGFGSSVQAPSSRHLRRGGGPVEIRGV